MRVIAGKFRRSVLKSVPAEERHLRPTSDRVRENVFNILGDRVRDVSFLDLFSGTGAVGIEAVSRGASRATFVENNPVSLKVIRENVDKLGISGDCCIARTDAVAFCSAPGARFAPFDIVYVDPPYASTDAQAALERLSSGALLSTGALVLVEQKSPPQQERVGQLVRADARRYSKTWIVVWKNVPGSAEKDPEKPGERVSETES